MERNINTKMNMPHISETVGWVCSIIGTFLGWAFLQIKDTTINLKLSTFWVEIGIVMCVVGCGFMVLISAMEKWNKYRERINNKKMVQFEKDNKSEIK